MAKVKVPIFGSPGKVALLDESATNGAIFGVNLFNEDGTVVKKEQIISDKVAQLSTLVAAKTESALARVENVKTAMLAADQALASDITTVRAALSVKVRVFRQASTPTPESPGDLWINTGDDNRLFIWSGAAWVESSDGRFGKRNRVFSQSAAPINDGTLIVNDLWINTNNNNLSRWSGTAWVDASDIRTSANATAISGLTSSVTSINGTLAAQAQFNQTIQTQANGNTSTITQQQTSIDGLLARAFLKLDVNGKVVGYEINNNGITNNFTVNADMFRVTTTAGVNVIDTTNIQGGIQRTDVKGFFEVSDWTTGNTIASFGTIAGLFLNNGLLVNSGDIRLTAPGPPGAPTVKIENAARVVFTNGGVDQALKSNGAWLLRESGASSYKIYDSGNFATGASVGDILMWSTLGGGSWVKTTPPWVTADNATLTGTTTATGTVNLQSTVQRGNANSPTTMTSQPRVFVQSTDPGAAAADGDLWFW